MIGGFWNIRGLNKSGRLDCISDFISYNNLDFVCLCETKKEHFTTALKSINRNFNWQWMPAKGTAGGILFGIKNMAAKIISCQYKEFCLSIMLKNSTDDMLWRLIVIYGSPYEEGKQRFIDEIHNMLESWNGPTLIGGDFNIAMFQYEKNNGIINQRWVDALNNWINFWGLLEYKSPERTYTWCNNQDQPIIANLDKIFCNTKLENAYPLASVKSASRAGSDHVPLIFNFGVHEVFKPKLFRFENWWLEREEFHELVFKTWLTPCRESDPIEVWQYKIRMLRKKIRGWARNVDAEIRKNKQALLREYDMLDVFQEDHSLAEKEKERMKEVI